MLLNNMKRTKSKNLYIFFGICIVVFVLISLGIANYFNLGIDRESEAKKSLSVCERLETSDERIDCWYDIVRKAYKKDGSEQAFAVFKVLYENSDEFKSSGCHRHAHRIGDTAYYEAYLAHKDIKKMNFPDLAKVCGYGFFHGFIEHMVQDRPQPDFVKESCEYLDESLTSTMPAIRITCFHGSGHGYALAAVDHADTSSWGDANALIGDSLILCEQTATRENEVEECKEGVFNVVVEWMADEDYGLKYDYNDPFWLCREQARENLQACYYEMAQKTDRVAEYDVIKAAELAQSIEAKEYSGMVFSVSLAGIMQSQLPMDRQYEYIVDCRNIHKSLMNNCIQAIISGMFEHGNPGEEHVKALELCDWDELVDDEKGKCYESVVNKLERFNSNMQIEQICEEHSGLRPYCS